MRLNGISDFKSLKSTDVTDVEFRGFMLLTGTNGAGKSHFLQGIQENAFIFEELGRLEYRDVRLFRLGELLANSEGLLPAGAYREPWSHLFNNVLAWKQEMLQERVDTPADELEGRLTDQALASGLISEQNLHQMTANAGKMLAEMDLVDFRDHYPLIAGSRDPFLVSISEVFLSYNGRKLDNELREYLFDRYGEGDGNFLSQAEFVARYGPKPWELLNEILADIGLPYSFPAPPNLQSANYEVQLEAPDGRLIRPGDLSSGERVLLAIAVGMFTGTNLTQSIQLPKVLLLDEADASLHPSMIKSLLNALEHTFVARYGITVVMTSHSATTVALAPEDSLFVMSRSGQRIRKTDTDEALQLLTVGISSLSVRVENRRQVFVESEYDQGIYQALFAILKGYVSTGRSAEFVAAGKRGNNGGCDMVKRLVRELRSAGIDSVFGLIDRDMREDAPDHILFVSDRYSIENLIFDPLPLGFFLLREGIVNAATMGWPESLRSHHLGKEHASTLAEFMETSLGFDAGNRTEVAYIGEFSVEVNRGFLDTTGHDLEKKVKLAFPALESYGRALMQKIVTLAVADKPEFTPRSIIEVFDAIS